MSHPNQLAFVKACANLIAPHFVSGKIIEIGSYSVNGEIRDFFNWASSYVGIDLTNGPGVDKVGSGHEYGESNSYDVAISSEVFEHNPYWLETFLNMVRITKPNGVVIFTCASKGRLEHGTDRTGPSDSPGTSTIGWTYYKNLVSKDFTQSIDFSQHFHFHRFYRVTSSKDLYFIGVKRTYAEAAKPNWLGREIIVLDKLVNKLNAEPSRKEPPRHPVLSFFRMLPLNISQHVISDSLYQDFYLKYISKTERLKSFLVGKQA